MPCRATGVILKRLLRSGHDMGVPDVPMASSVTCRLAASGRAAAVACSASPATGPMKRALAASGIDPIEPWSCASASARCGAEPPVKDPG